MHKSSRCAFRLRYSVTPISSGGRVREFVGSVSSTAARMDINSMTVKDARNIMPQTCVQGVPEKDASLMAAGRDPMIKNNQRGHVGCLGTLESVFSEFVLLPKQSDAALEGDTRRYIDVVSHSRRIERPSAQHTMGELDRYMR